MNSETTMFYKEAESVLSQIDFAGAGDDSIRNFRLSPPSDHEKAVIQAMEWFLRNDRDSFLNYRVARGSTMPELTVGTYDIFRDKFRSYLHSDRAAMVLKWAILLHDIGKGRGATEPHCETSAKIVREIFDKGSAGAIADLTKDEKDFIVWIVRHHDVMGNINTGERSPGYLNRITRNGGNGIPSLPDWEKGLAFLQFSMLCDLRGTGRQGQYGVYLTDAKARFWCKLSDQEAIRKLTNSFYEYRTMRWTGGLDGSPHPKQDQTLRSLVNEKTPATRAKIIEFFRKKITYIVNGYYLLDALTSKEIAELMERVVEAEHSDGSCPQGEVTLEFTMGYRRGEPLSEKMLDRMRESLGGGNTRQLRIEYVACHTIRVCNRELGEE